MCSKTTGSNGNSSPRLVGKKTQIGRRIPQSLGGIKIVHVMIQGGGTGGWGKIKHDSQDVKGGQECAGS